MSEKWLMTLPTIVPLIPIEVLYREFCGQSPDECPLLGVLVTVAYEHRLKVHGLCNTPT